MGERENFLANICEHRNSGEGYNFNLTHPLYSPPLKGGDGYCLKRTYSPIDLFTYSLKKKHAAFTLSEVLITLGIIGIVAAFVLPAFVKSYQERRYAVMWKKKYSEIARIYNLVKDEMGGNICVATKDGDFNIPVKCAKPGRGFQSNSEYSTLSPEFVEKFVSYFKVIESCGFPQYGESEYCANYYYPWTGLCGGATAYSMYDSLKTSSPASLRKQESPYSCPNTGTLYAGWDFMHKAILLPDGTTIYFGGWATGMIAVDVNSFAKGPNVLGKDFFAAMVTNDWIKPLGAEGTFNRNTNGDICECSPDFGVESGQGFLGSYNLLDGKVLAGACCSSEKLYSY